MEMATIEKLIAKSSPENGLDPQLESSLNALLLQVEESCKKVKKDFAEINKMATQNLPMDSTNLIAHIAGIEQNLSSLQRFDAMRNTLLGQLKSASELVERGKIRNAQKLLTSLEQEYQMLLRSSLTLDEQRELYRTLVSEYVQVSKSVAKDNATKQVLLKRCKAHMKTVLTGLESDDVQLVRKNIDVVELLMNSLRGGE